MLNERLKAADATLTESELQAIAKTAYGEMLGRTCDDQRRFPHQFEMHSLANRSWADFYQRQCENGGHVPLLSGEEQGLRLRGWDQDRIDRLTAIVQLVVEGTQPIKNRFIDHHLEELGFEPCDARRSVVRRALYPAYRDACLHAEQALQTAITTPALVTPPIVSARADEIVVSDESPAKTKPLMSEIMQRAANGLVADEQWGAKSGRQLFSTVKLFELLIGPKAFESITQAELAAFKSKLRFVPKRYSMSDAKSRNAVLETVAACEAKEKAADGKADKKTYTLSNRTLNRHLSSLATLHFWARTNGQAVPVLVFDDLQAKTSKRIRARNERPAVKDIDILKLFALPTFCGSAPHAGGTGQIVLRARKTKGISVVHDAFYWVPLLLYYSGARREEVCKLSIDDVIDYFGISFIMIDFTEFGQLKNDQSVRPVPLHSELLRLGFMEFVAECRRRGYRELFPELRPTNEVQNYGDVYSKNIWRHLRSWGGLASEATIHGLRHRFSTSLKAKKVFSEFRLELMGQVGQNIAEERYSDASALQELKDVVEELPSATDHLQCGVLNLPQAANRLPQPKKRRVS